MLDLGNDQVTVLDGIPIVRPERLLFELCAAVHPARAERALDTALAKRLCSVASVRRIHTQLAERGRAGTVLLRSLLEVREVDGWAPPESNLEARFAQIMRDAGIGPWRRQVDLGADSWCGRLVAAGFEVVEIWDTAVWHDRTMVIAAVRKGIGEVRRGVRSPDLQLHGSLGRSR